MKLVHSPGPAFGADVFAFAKVVAAGEAEEEAGLAGGGDPAAQAESAEVFIDEVRGVEEEEEAEEGVGDVEGAGKGDGDAEGEADEGEAKGGDGEEEGEGVGEGFGH